jgi:hypothetical protein
VKTTKRSETVEAFGGEHNSVPTLVGRPDVIIDLCDLYEQAGLVLEMQDGKLYIQQDVNQAADPFFQNAFRDMVRAGGYTVPGPEHDILTTAVRAALIKIQFMKFIK